MVDVNDPYYNYLQKTSSAESSGNPYAKAKTSSASGLWQFTDSTWKEVVNKYNLGYTLNDRFNPEKAEKVMRLFTQDNEKQLKPILGRDLTDSERYLGHFLGIKGAGNLFKAYKKDGNMPVDYYISPKALQANKSIFYNKDGSIKTTKQVYDWANKKMGDSPTYANSVAPYINPTQNIDFSNSAEGITFEEEKPEKETEATQALKVLQEKQKEEDFLTELFSEQEQKIAELYKPIEEEQSSQSQSYDYNDISNFVESPILAQQGGSYQDAMRGMMKSKIGMGNAFNNPAIKRMSQAMPKTGITPEGIGTHYMASMGNYAVSLLQDKGNKELTYNENPPPSSEDIYFDRPSDAEYFAEHYKEVAPMSTIFKELNSFQDGGIKIDNIGYWNPDNWGKPVQINSNNITMQGVREPLYGYAPETGERRLMMPETNHIFKGASKVIETPLTDKEKQFLKEITKIK